MSELQADCALETLRFAIMDAIAKTGHSHRMSPDAADLVITEIIRSILEPPTVWATKLLADRITAN